MKQRMSDEYVQDFLEYVKRGGLMTTRELLLEIESLAVEVQERRATDRVASELYFVSLEVDGIGICLQGPWGWNTAQGQLNGLANDDRFRNACLICATEVLPGDAP